MEIRPHERKSHFRFKQFTVAHDRSTMKVGTDAVLIGAWTNVDNATTVLDIGTGCGIIALMLAQRTANSAHIHAVELDHESFIQAGENFINSPWPERLFVHHTSIQTFEPSLKYDLIISNPPFFNKSLQPPDERRGYARHTSSLSFSDLIRAVDRLLTSEGRFNVILPFHEGLEFMSLAETSRFVCTRQWKVKSKDHKPWERWLMEFRRNADKADIIEYGEIVISGNDGHWSDDYIRMTKEFYWVL